MNNFEYLKSLKAEELTQYLSCSACSLKKEDINCVGFDCAYYQYAWLMEERKNAKQKD